MAKSRVALTATVIDCELWLEDWIAHHLHVVDHLFIWADDPGELPVVSAFSSDRVSVMPGQQLEGPSRLTRVLKRQQANADAAIQFAAMAGFDWLVHLDLDELFVPLQQDWWAVDTDQTVFRNHEAVPVWESARPFREMTRFRRHGVHSFLLYENGKAAVSLAGDARSRTALGVHRFDVERTHYTERAVVLHYAMPGFAHWWRKYERLGAFSDYWLDSAKDPIDRDFHKRSRDVVMRALEIGDDCDARAFYCQHVEHVDDADLVTAKWDPSGEVRIV